MSARSFKRKLIRDSLDDCREKQRRANAKFIKKMERTTTRIKSGYEFEMKQLFEEDARLCGELRKLDGEE